MYRIEFTPEVSKIVKKWKKSNPILYKKLVKILHELIDHPRVGLGHPEALIGGDGITYSRRISANYRIIYDIYDDKVLVLIIGLQGHYDDK